jgi:hypothetical protein
MVDFKVTDIVFFLIESMRNIMVRHKSSVHGPQLIHKLRTTAEPESHHFLEVMRSHHRKPKVNITKIVLMRPRDYIGSPIEHLTLPEGPKGNSLRTVRGKPRVPVQLFLNPQPPPVPPAQESVQGVEQQTLPELFSPPTTFSTWSDEVSPYPDDDSN